MPSRRKVTLEEVRAVVEEDLEERMAKLRADGKRAPSSPSASAKSERPRGAAASRRSSRAGRSRSSQPPPAALASS